MPTPHREAARIADLHWGKLPAGQKIGKIAAVFPRIEAKPAIEKMQELEIDGEGAAGRGAGQEAAPEPAAAAAATATDKITIDDFAKVDLRVGQVKSAERVKGADKLLHLKVDIGEAAAAHHRRRHRGGLPAGTAGRPQGGDRREPAAAQTARASNRKGMIVAASLEGGKPVLAAFLEDVPVGARLK